MSAKRTIPPPPIRPDAGRVADLDRPVQGPEHPGRGSAVAPAAAWLRAAGPGKAGVNSRQCDAGPCDAHPSLGGPVGVVGRTPAMRPRQPGPGCARTR